MGKGHRQRKREAKRNRKKNRNRFYNHIKKAKKWFTPIVKDEFTTIMVDSEGNNI